MLLSFLTDDRLRDRIAKNLRFGRSISDVRGYLRDYGVSLGYVETVREVERLGFLVENVSKVPGRNHILVSVPVARRSI